MLDELTTFPPIPRYQSRKGSWTELNGSTCPHAANWSEQIGSRPNQVGDLNWTNSLNNLNYEPNLLHSRKQYTELSELGTKQTESRHLPPPCSELNWTAANPNRQANWTEVMSSYFELRKRRPCKLTNSSGPARYIPTYLSTPLAPAKPNQCSFISTSQTLVRNMLITNIHHLPEWDKKYR